MTDNILRLDKIEIICYFEPKMGRKTKKEKILADLRKKIQKLENNSFSQDQNQMINKEISSISSSDDSIYVYPVDLIKKDLFKTFILSMLAFFFELALFLIIKKKIYLPFPKLVLPISLSFS